jgi:glutamate racemase
MQHKGAIGVFDSGYGGLTVLKEIVHQLPQYNYVYLGDNARAPYGTRSFETVYQYTWEAVQWFFAQGCPLVILACNTASAKALRTIQQNDLPKLAEKHQRVLGVIRPTTEIIGTFTDTGHVGVLGTNGTVQSDSYPIEIEKFFPNVKVFQQACPMWVPLIENNEHHSKGADFFVKEYIHQLMYQSPKIDTVLLACTHYPLLMHKIKEYTPADTKIVSQGQIVATGLENYLQRHPEMDAFCKKESKLSFYTTDDTETFNKQAAIFFEKYIQSKHANLNG